MNISELIHKCANDVFHISSIKPFQLLVTHRIVEQFESEECKNQIVILPTGSGKSLCFLIPAVLCKKITIIIYPLLALMNDQIEKLSNLGIKCVNLRGGQSAKQRQDIFNQLKADTRIVITNPETLNQEKIIKELQSFEIEMVVVDESHVISQWGKDFRPDYVKLKDTIKILNPHQILAFTATASDKTVKDICSVLFEDEPIIVRTDADRDNIFYSAYPVFSKTEGVVELLKSCQRPAIVFCGTQNQTYVLCMFIKMIYPSYPMRYYHAGLSKQERQAIENWFKVTNQAVLFTTCAYGMGVDLPGIRTIIHYDLPADSLEYLQESGRAGRDRKDAQAWVIVPYGQKEYQGLMKVFTDKKCRRKALLESLEEYKEECAGCDVCTESVIEYPYGYKEINLFVKRYSFKFSIHTTAGILCGDPMYHKFQSNPFYGLVDMNGLMLRETIKAMNLKSVFIKKRGMVLYSDTRINRLIARFCKKKEPI